MEFHLPDNLYQWLEITLPILFLVAACAAILLPLRLLGLAGLTADHEIAKARNGARTQFGGFALGASCCAIAFGQPVLLATLSSALAMAAIVAVVEYAAEQTRRAVSLFPAVLLAALAMFGLSLGGLPALTPSIPDSLSDHILFLSALSAVGAGMHPVILRAHYRKFHGFRPTDRRKVVFPLPAIHSGLAITLGLAALLIGNPFAALALGAGWAGRVIVRALSLVLDRHAPRANLVLLGCEALLALASVAGILGWVR